MERIRKKERITGGYRMTDKKKELIYDENGEMAVHQQLSESYQSGVIDQEEQKEAKKLPRKADRKSYY